MPRKKRTIIEYRNYNLSAIFPVLLLTGENWRISDVPSGRLHIHNCLEIGLCESDSGFMEFEDKRHPFQEGDVTVISCDVPHTTYSTPGCASSWSYLFVDIQQIFQSFFPHSEPNNLDILNITNRHLCLILSQKKYPVINNIVREIIDEMKEKEAYYELTVRGLFLSLIPQLIRVIEKNPTPVDPLPNNNALPIAPALEYIQYHYAEDFSMDHLAQLCNLSPTHFRRLFLSIMKVSPLKHLHITRVNQAANLLRMTEKSVLEICELTGFHSISNFNRHFFDIMGETPSEFRKRTSYMKNHSIMTYNGWMYAEALAKPPQST